MLSLDVRLISIRLRAAPFNITIIQIMHQHLDIKTVKSTNSGNYRPNIKEGHSGCTEGLACLSWEECTDRLGRPYSNVKTNERGLSLLEFALFTI